LWLRQCDIFRSLVISQPEKDGLANFVILRHFLVGDLNDQAGSKIGDALLTWRIGEGWFADRKLWNAIGG